MKYYIYHIPEKRKIGVTINIKKRMREHKWKGPYEILEEHTCPQTAGDRELELQEKFGYPKDVHHYTYSGTLGLSGEPGKKGGLKGSYAAHKVMRESGWYQSEEFKNNMRSNVKKTHKIMRESGQYQSEWFKELARNNQKKGQETMKKNNTHIEIGRMLRKISYEDAMEIRKSYKKGVSVKNLSEQFGVSQSTTYNILQNKIYKTK